MKKISQKLAEEMYQYLLKRRCADPICYYSKAGKCQHDWEALPFKYTCLGNNELCQLWDRDKNCGKCLPCRLRRANEKNKVNHKAAKKDR